MDCEIEVGVYFVILDYLERMDERVFQYSIHGGRAKDDPYFSDYFSAPIEHKNEDELDDFDIEQFNNARRYLIGKQQSSNS